MILSPHASVLGSMHVFVSGRHADQTTGHKDPKLLFFGGRGMSGHGTCHMPQKHNQNLIIFNPFLPPAYKHGQLVGGRKKISNFVSRSLERIRRGQFSLYLLSNGFAKASFASGFQMLPLLNIYCKGENCRRCP